MFLFVFLTWLSVYLNTPSPGGTRRRTRGRRSPDPRSFPPSSPPAPSAASSRSCGWRPGRAGPAWAAEVGRRVEAGVEVEVAEPRRARRCKRSCFFFFNGTQTTVHSMEPNYLVKLKHILGVQIVSCCKKRQTEQKCLGLVRAEGFTAAQCSACCVHVTPLLPGAVCGDCAAEALLQFLLNAESLSVLDV